MIFWLPFIIGLIIGIVKTIIKPDNMVYHNIETIENNTDIPYYLEEELNSLYNQIAAYHNKIDLINNELDYTSDINKINKLEIQRSNIEYKLARLENKAYNLNKKLYPD